MRGGIASNDDGPVIGEGCHILQSNSKKDRRYSFKFRGLQAGMIRLAPQIEYAWKENKTKTQTKTEMSSMAPATIYLRPLIFL